MGTLEKLSENHEFDTVRKRFAKKRDFHFRTAPDHSKEAVCLGTRKLMDFGPETVRIGPECARMNAVFDKALPYSFQIMVQNMSKFVKFAIFAENPRWGPWKSRQKITNLML